MVKSPALSIQPNPSVIIIYYAYSTASKIYIFILPLLPESQLTWLIGKKELIERSANQLGTCRGCFLGGNVWWRRLGVESREYSKLVIDGNVWAFKWGQGDSSPMSSLPDCCWGKQIRMRNTKQVQMRNAKQVRMGNTMGKAQASNQLTPTWLHSIGNFSSLHLYKM